MTILVVILIFVLGMVGLYYILQKDSQVDQVVAPIYHSGVYSLLKKSPRDSLNKNKLDADEVAKLLLEDESLHDQDRQSLLEMWSESIDLTVGEVEKGDESGVQTYGYEIPASEVELCSFINENTYNTREMIYNYPELLPPFYIGSRIKLLAKQPWQSPKKGGWQPLLPVDGQYSAPNIRQITKVHLHNNGG
jgi:hypothetical protein